MFTQVYIVQCASSGDFIGAEDLFTGDFSKVHLFMNEPSALKTAMDLLDEDFRVCTFFIHQPIGFFDESVRVTRARIDSAENPAPPSNTGGTKGLY